jgi:hypothetical protein
MKQIVFVAAIFVSTLFSSSDVLAIDLNLPECEQMDIRCQGERRGSISEIFVEVGGLWNEYWRLDMTMSEKNEHSLLPILQSFRDRMGKCSMDAKCTVAEVESILVEGKRIQAVIEKIRNPSSGNDSVVPQQQDQFSGESGENQSIESLRDDRRKLIQNAKNIYASFTSSGYDSSKHPELERNKKLLESSDYYLCERTTECTFDEQYLAANSVISIVSELHSEMKILLDRIEKLTIQFDNRVSEGVEIINDFKVFVREWDKCPDIVCGMSSSKKLDGEDRERIRSMTVRIENDRDFIRETRSARWANVDELQSLYISLDSELNRISERISREKIVLSEINARYLVAVQEEQERIAEETLRLAEEKRLERLEYERKKQELAAHREKIIEEEGLATESERSVFVKKYAIQCSQDSGNSSLCRKVGLCMSKKNYPNSVFVSLASPSSLMSVDEAFATEVGSDLATLAMVVQLNGDCD